MTAPARRVRARVSPLPAPELVSLIDDPTGPYADSPDGWWTEYGGALDIRSGVVYLPGPKSPPCPLTCPRRKGASARD
jgi:hypothetical protein